MKLTKTFLSAKPNPWGKMVVAFALLFLLGSSVFFWNHLSFTHLLTASREQVFQRHEWWRLFTTLAIHGDIPHLLSNSLFFSIFGFLLYGYFGTFAFPVLALFGGALTNFATLYFYPADASLIGASGVVYWMVGFWTAVYFYIERGKKPMTRLMNGLGIGLTLFFPTSYEPHVSYLAHAWGYLFGISFGIAYFYVFKAQLRRAEVWIEREEPAALIEESTEESIQKDCV